LPIPVIDVAATQLAEFMAAQAAGLREFHQLRPVFRLKVAVMVLLAP
jgi:hypothetical protein